LFKRLIVRLVFWVAAVAFCPRPAICATRVTVKARPNKITVGALFSGADVAVSGTIPAGSEAVVIVTGGLQDLPLKTKGRAFGILWMNLGNVTFHHVPTLYIVNAANTLEQSGASDSGEGQSLGVGFDSLKAQWEITPNLGDKDKDVWSREFLKLKKSEGLYAVHDGTVHYGSAENGMRSFETDIHIPARVPPGEYEVKVLALNGGQVADAATEHIEVEEVGVPAFLSSLSFKHGGLYGLLAVLVAIGAGLLMDFFFGEQQGAH
jgi:uncharacterized protein (TIGR02186 family)